MKVRFLPDIRKPFTKRSWLRNPIMVVSIKQNQGANSLTVLDQSLRHFISNRAAHAIATQVIGPRWLQAADFAEVISCHVLHAGQVTPFSVQSRRLQSVEWIIRPKVPRQVAVKQNVARSPVNAEQWRPGALGLDRHQREPASGSIGLL